MATIAKEEKTRYEDVSYSENTNNNIDNNNNYYNYNNNNYNNSTLEINVPIVMGSNHNHENEDWTAWVKPCTMVDEQMSWGSTWYSFWEGDANSNEFYSDVVEDDLWGLKTIQHPPS
ncbi:unnamed protein product [Amaranthus hypochondriacus]